MAKEKVYAVRIGKNPGIYYSWEECQNQIYGYPEAEVKSFNTLEEAKRYLNMQEKEYPILDPSIYTAYVDGSFNAATNEYSFGCVLLYDDKVMTFKKSFPEDEFSPHRNVAGEVKGAAFIINYCINRGVKKMRLFYDYQGISKWYQDEWKANLPFTIQYKNFATEAKKKIDVEFYKVKGHSNDKYNDMADALAKEALGIK